MPLHAHDYNFEQRQNKKIKNNNITCNLFTGNIYIYILEIKNDLNKIIFKKKMKVIYIFIK